MTAAVFATWWLLSPPALAQAPARVLVMPFAVQADGASPAAVLAVRWLGEAASTLLSEELASRGYAALAREDRVAVFDQLRLPMSAELTRATLIRVAELIGATHVVFGEIHAGAELSVRARMIMLETGRLLEDVTDRGALPDLFVLFGRVAGALGRQAGPPSGKTSALPMAMSMTAFENYIKGLTAPTQAGQQKWLETAMMQAPRNGRVLTALWDVYTDQGLHDKALAVASGVPVESPFRRRARFDVALSLIELKRLDGAVKELSALYASSPAAALSNALGIVELRRMPAPGSAERAAAYFERAASEARGDTDYLFNLGYARALSGDTAAALVWLREAVRHNATDGDAHLVMSAVLASTGHGPEAQRELDLARILGTQLESVPATLVKVPPSLERVRTRLDDAASAATPIQGTRSDSQETAAFHLSNARTLIDAGRDREATAELQRSIYLLPYQDEPHLLLGRLYERTGRVADAVDEYKVAVWCRESAAAQLALGRALAQTGDRDAARRALERALALAPDLAEAREWLKKIGG
ncbi:MAG TPA: tetratricopeptide repeat protein [Vicinamibacterales bacterium]|nr:tetratricopeptide repeat protein [Vicinamibacterales bacterium]